MKLMHSRLIKIASDLANAPFSVPPEWSKAECKEAHARLNDLLHDLAGHQEALHHITGVWCEKTNEIAQAICGQMMDIEEAMETR
jgi:hypothetical protein